MKWHRGCGSLIMKTKLKDGSWLFVSKATLWTLLSLSLKLKCNTIRQ